MAEFIIKKKNSINLSANYNITPLKNAKKITIQLKKTN